MSRYLKEAIRAHASSIVFGLLIGEVSSDQGQRDHEYLLKNARNVVLSVSETPPKVEILRELVDKKIRVELIVGPSQEAQDIETLQNMGVNVLQFDRPIVQPFSVVDGAHVFVTEPTIYGVDTQTQYIMRHASMLASDRAIFFEKLRKSILSKTPLWKSANKKEKPSPFTCNWCGSGAMKYAEIFSEGHCTSCGGPAGTSLIKHGH